MGAHTVTLLGRDKYALCVVALRRRKDEVAVEEVAHDALRLAKVFTDELVGGLLKQLIAHSLILALAVEHEVFYLEGDIVPLGVNVLCTCGGRQYRCELESEKADQNQT